MKIFASLWLFLMLLFFAGPISASSDSAVLLFKKGDHQKAIEMLEDMAAKGDTNAQYNLANIYLRTAPPKFRDVVRGLKWLRLSAEQGNGYADYFFYQLYSEGIGVEKNSLNALVSLQKAAKRNVLMAQYIYGRKLYDGEVGPRKIKEGTDWILVAANQNLRVAQYWLGTNIALESRFSQFPEDPEYYEMMSYKWLTLSIDDRYQRRNLSPRKVVEKIETTVPTLLAKLEKSLDDSTLTIVKDLLKDWAPSLTRAELSKRLKADEFCVGFC